MKILGEIALERAFEFLEAGEPGRAKPLVEDSLSADLENRSLEFLLRCVTFWHNILPVPPSEEDKIQCGEELIQQWKHFILFVRQSNSSKSEAMPEFWNRVRDSLCKGVFTSALDCFLSVLSLREVSQRGDVLCRVALCYKKLGQYEKALENLKEVNTLLPNMAAVLAEMADCYALCGDERTAKMLFREAFFIDASKIDLSFLDSRMILSLVELVAAKGFSGKALQEWIPVYGALYGVFTIHRQLLALEAAKLKQGIFALEMNMKESGSDHSVLQPRLINHYFWLICHLMLQQEDRKKVEEVLMKINLLDSDIYRQYTGSEGATR